MFKAYQNNKIMKASQGIFRTTAAMYFSFVLLSNTNVCSGQITTILPADKKITYAGRIGFERNNEADIYWPGSSIKVSFKGTSLKAVIRDKPGNNYFYVITDGDTTGLQKTTFDTAKKTYVLAENLPFAKHTVEIFKLTNTTTATTFYGFELDGKAKVLKAAAKPKRKIEFFGNSITAGHGVDVKPDSTDSGASIFFNNYKTYAAITARHFNAQYSCVARSGIGVMVSWFPEIMPETYDRLNPFDSTSKWDFTRYTPNIVVINLLQNDYWLINMPANEQFKSRFGIEKPDSTFIINAYKNFLQQVRGKYNKATIICTLGSMNATEAGSPFPRYITKAIEAMNDKNILHHFYSDKKSPGHPKVKDQQVMATSLINFIEKNVKW